MSAYKHADTKELGDITSKLAKIHIKYKSNEDTYKDISKVFELGTMYGRIKQSLDYMQVLSDEYAKIKKEV